MDVANMSRPKRFVDAHIHLWRLASGWYPMLDRAPDPTIEDEHGVGDFSRLMGRDYLLPQYFADAAGFNVTKIVHVTACQAPASWPDETRWLQALYEKEGFPHAIVGWTDIRRPIAEIDRELGEHAESANFRGIRNHEGVDYRSEHTAEAFGIMARRGLLYDAVCHEDSHGDLAKTIDRYPNMSFVIEHSGWPTKADKSTFDLWRAGMRKIARRPNATVKISGLGMVMHRWTTAEFRPWVLALIESFGPERCMFGTNFPVDGLYSSYGTLLNAFVEITQQFSDDEVDQLFASTAERVYRI